MFEMLIDDLACKDHPCRKLLSIVNFERLCGTRSRGQRSKSIPPPSLIASKPPLDPSIFHFLETRSSKKNLKKRETLWNAIHAAPSEAY